MRASLPGRRRRGRPAGRFDRRSAGPLAYAAAERRRGNLAAKLAAALTWVKAGLAGRPYEGRVHGRNPPVSRNSWKEELAMAEAATKLSVRQEEKSAAAPAPRRALSVWQPFESLRDEVDRIFEEFTRGFGGLPMARRLFDIEPFGRVERAFAIRAPAVDFVEKEKEYRITVELPGIDEKDIAVSIADDVMTIKGEKKEEKEEKEENYYLSERRYGAFQRSFQLPSGVDHAKIEAGFQKGVLTVTLPKTPEAQKKEKKIAIKAK
jgi:HSP20 family protein